MSILNKLASSLGRSDEVPNQLLAQEIAASGDRAAVRELVEHLADPDKAIRHDCIKVLYEIGYTTPDLIADYAADFLALLRSSDNRMVWGGMTALGVIADRQAAALWDQIDLILTTTEKGSVITQDWGVRVLATLSAHDPLYEARIFPFLLSFLRKCPPKDLPRHAESCLTAVNRDNRAAVQSLIEARAGVLKPAQAKRLGAVLRKINAL